jgi:flagellar motor protein MotB
MDIVSRMTRPSGGKPSANIVAMLSLKLLLLAFFILLSTMSQFEEERSRAVLDSVAVAFKGEVRATEGRLRPDAGEGRQAKQASLSKRIEALFRQTLPVVEVSKAADGSVLRLETPASSLFDMGQAELRAQRGVLVRRLANVLSDPSRAPAAFRIEVLHAVPKGDGAGAARLPAARTGTLVRALAGHGIGRDRLASGLWPTTGDAGRIAFEITLPEDMLQPGALDTGGSADGGAR